MKHQKTTEEELTNLASKVEKAVSQQDFINGFIPLNRCTNPAFRKELQIFRNREN
jgi:hypothetical protein